MPLAPPQGAALLGRRRPLGWGCAGCCCCQAPPLRLLTLQVVVKRPQRAEALLLLRQPVRARGQG